jgi:hypothetical protein
MKKKKKNDGAVLPLVGARIGESLTLAAKVGGLPLPAFQVTEMFPDY